MLDNLLKQCYDLIKAFELGKTDSIIKGGENMSTWERTDRLRRRPDKVRYYYLAVSNKTLHTGMSHGGLSYVENNHTVVALYISDLLNKTVIEVTEPISDFMDRWRGNYNNPAWDYAKDIEDKVPVPRGE